MNKKAFAITTMELVRLLIVIIFGIGLWLIYSSIKDWIVETYSMTPLATAFTGLVIVLAVIFIVKYKPHKFVLG